MVENESSPGFWKSLIFLPFSVILVNERSCRLRFRCLRSPARQVLRGATGAALFIPRLPVLLFTSHTKHLWQHILNMRADGINRFLRWREARQASKGPPPRGLGSRAKDDKPGGEGEQMEGNTAGMHLP